MAISRFTLSDAPGQNSCPRQSSCFSAVSRQYFFLFLLIIFCNFVFILCCTCPKGPSLHHLLHSFISLPHRGSPVFDHRFINNHLVLILARTSPSNQCTHSYTTACFYFISVITPPMHTRFPCDFFFPNIVPGRIPRSHDIPFWSSTPTFSIAFSYGKDPSFHSLGMAHVFKLGPIL